MRFGSVHASKRNSALARNTFRTTRVSLSSRGAIGPAFALAFAAIVDAHERLELVQPRLPVVAVALEPLDATVERLRPELEPDRPPVRRLRPAADELAALEHLDVLGDGSKGQARAVRELREVGGRARQHRQNVPPRRIRQRVKQVIEQRRGPPRAHVEIITPYGLMLASGMDRTTMHPGCTKPHFVRNWLRRRRSGGSSRVV